MKISHKDWQGWFVAHQGGEIADYHFAYNTFTGERGPLRDTYDQALSDIPNSGNDKRPLSR